MRSATAGGVTRRPFVLGGRRQDFLLNSFAVAR